MATTKKLPNPYKNKKPAPKKDLSELSQLHKDAIFNHEGCRKEFDARIKEVKLTVTPELKSIVAAFKCVLPELSDAQLNLSDVDGEYEQLISLLQDDGGTIGNECPTHQGIIILMCNQIRKQPEKVYAANLETRLNVHSAGKTVLKSITELYEPIRDTCIAEWYEKATDDEMLDINITVKHRQDPQGQGMPGNGGVQQFRMQ
jgi:hypothetical protein